MAESGWFQELEVEGLLKGSTSTDGSSSTIYARSHSGSSSPLLFDDPQISSGSYASNQVLMHPPAKVPVATPPLHLSHPPLTDPHSNSLVPHCAEDHMSSQHSSSVWGRAAGWATVMMDPHVMSSQGEQQSAVIGIPESEVYPGPFGFKVHLPANKYNPSTNTLLLRPDELFPATFQFAGTPPTKKCSIRALVCCKEPHDVIKLGPCRRCLRHPAEDTSNPASNHFLLSNNSRAVYGVHLSHKIVTVPLDGLNAEEEGLTCLYKCVCHSTCIVGRSRNRASLILIFSLINNGNEIGRDVVNLCSCSNPTRVAKRVRQSEVSEDCEEQPPFPKLKRRQNVYDVDPDMDEEGYYNFTWRGKERLIFDTLNIIKQGQMNGPRKQ